MTSHICSIVGCDREVEANGMCAQHFTSALVHGVFHTHRRNAAHPAVQAAQRAVAC